MLLPPALGFSPHPPVSVYGTGPRRTIAAFLGSCFRCFTTLFRSTSGTSILHVVFPPCLKLSLVPVFPFPAHPLQPRPRSSVALGYRNLHLLSIGYALRPPLRPRLSQGRSALPWNPWIFGLEDSHLHLATHSGILPPCHSTAPFGTASLQQGCSPTTQ